MGRARPLGPRDLAPLVCFALLAWGAWVARPLWEPALFPDAVAEGGEDGEDATTHGDTDDVEPLDAPQPDGAAEATAALTEHAPAPAPRESDTHDAPATALAVASDALGADSSQPPDLDATALPDAPTADADPPATSSAADHAPLTDDATDAADGERRWLPGTRHSPLEQAFAEAPHDPAALAPLLTWLLDSGRPDLAREQIVIHAEEGGDPAHVEALQAAHDPHRQAKADVLLEAARQHAAAAESFGERELWRSAWALSDGALALLEGARLEAGRALVDERAGALPRALETWRGRMARDRDAVAALVAAGARLPDSVDAAASLRATSDARQDARAAAAGDPLQRSTTRHFEVHTERGAALTRQAGEVLEAAYDLARRSFDADPLASGRPLLVEVLADDLAFTRRRARLDPPALPDADAFREADGVLVIRDPTLDGGDAARLWQVLGREARRLVVVARLGAAARDGWLATGLALQGEGTRRLADGRVRLDAVPAVLLDESLASLRGWGTGRPRVESVLALGAQASGGPVWSWALVHYLRHVGPWADPLPTLLEAGRSTEGALLLRTAVLSDPGVRRTGLEDTRDVESAWNLWLEEQRALEDGEAPALEREVERARAAHAARDSARAEALLAPVRRVAPGHAQALALAVELSARRADRDQALLLARWLAAVRAPERSAEERHAEALGLHVPVAAALLDVEAALRAPVLALAATLRDEGDARSALRLLDRALAAAPLDRALTTRRAELAQAIGPDAGQVWLRPPALDDVAGLFGERDLWTPTGHSLEVSVADRSEPTTLRGLIHLRPPCSVSVRLRLDADPGATTQDDDQATLGLLFGGDEPIAHGAWGVLVSRSGRVELARRGGLEWPSTTLGRGRRGLTELTVGLGRERLSVAVDGRPPVVLPRGSRPLAGWLALRARRTRGAFLALSVQRSRLPDPTAVWYVGGG